MKYLLPALTFCAIVTAQAQPTIRERFVENASQKVVLRGETFFPKSETQGKNYLGGSWFPALERTQTPWHAGYGGDPTAGYDYWNAMSAQFPGAQVRVQGFPSLLLSAVLTTPESKAQFMADLLDGTLSNNHLQQGPPLGPVTGMRTVLQDDREYAQTFFVEAFKKQEAGTLQSTSINAIIFQGGQQELDLRGTGITQERFLDAFPLGDTTATTALSYLIFDE